MRRVHLGAHTYRAAVMALGPVGYWRLGEASGTVAKDETGANDGTYVGAPTLGVAGLLTGDPNTAMRSASGKYMTAAAGGFTTADNWSFGAWLRPASLSQLGTAFLAGSASKGVQFGLGDGVGGAGAKLMISLVNVAWVDSLYTFPDTTSRHLVILTRDATTIRVHVDGVQTATSAAVPLAPSGRVYIGVHEASWPFAGDVDEVAIWNRALTAAEIARLYRIGRGF